MNPFPWILGSLACTAGIALGDVVHLRDGTTLECEQAEYRKGEVVIRKAGEKAETRLPRDKVKYLEDEPTEEERAAAKAAFKKDFAGNKHITNDNWGQIVRVSEGSCLRWVAFPECQFVLPTGWYTMQKRDIAGELELISFVEPGPKQNTLMAVSYGLKPESWDGTAEDELKENMEGYKALYENFKPGKKTSVTIAGFEALRQDFSGTNPGSKEKQRVIELVVPLGEKTGVVFTLYAAEGQNFAAKEKVFLEMAGSLQLAGPGK